MGGGGDDTLGLSTPCSAAEAPRGLPAESLREARPRPEARSLLPDSSMLKRVRWRGIQQEIIGEYVLFPVHVSNLFLQKQVRSINRPFFSLVFSLIGITTRAFLCAHKLLGA